MAYIQTPDNVYGNAKVYGGAMVYGNAKVYGNASVYGDAMVYGNAKVSGDASVYGNASVYGDADIQSNDDWFSFIYQKKTLTGYRSRNKLGYDLNVNGLGVAIDDLESDAIPFVKSLINKFTPLTNPENEYIEKIISDLEKQLDDAKNKLKSL